MMHKAQLWNFQAAKKPLNKSQCTVPSLEWLRTPAGEAAFIYFFLFVALC